MKSQEKILPEVQTLWDADNNCAQSTGAGILENLGYKEDAQVLFDSFYCFGGGLSRLLLALFCRLLFDQVQQRLLLRFRLGK